MFQPIKWLTDHKKPGQHWHVTKKNLEWSTVMHRNDHKHIKTAEKNKQLQRNSIVSNRLSRSVFETSISHKVSNIWSNTKQRSLMKYFCHDSF